MKKISILIPCYNEEKTIKLIIDKVLQADTLQLEKEIIVINDGSTDQCSQILDKYLDVIKVLHLQKNQGKGFAIEQAKLLISGDLVLIQDADLEYSPSDYPALIKPFLEQQSLAVFGIRNREGQYYKFLLNPYFWGGAFINHFFNLLAGAKLKDLHVGYKLVRSEIFCQLEFREFQFSFCHELAWKLVEKQIKIDQVPISYHPRTLKEGKKIRPRHGVSALFFILKKYARKRAMV